jgi:hypothetical protein
MSYWNTLVSMLSPSKTTETQNKHSDPGACNRLAVRKAQRMKDGFIWSEGMLAPRACTIRDMTPLGARVDIWNDDIKPSLLRGKFKLYSCAEQMEVDCTLARREGSSLGLRFLSKFQEPTRKYT